MPTISNLSFVPKLLFLAVLSMCEIALSSVAVAGDIENTTNTTYTTNRIPLSAYFFRGHYYVCTVTEKHLMTTPRMEMERNEPPLSPRSAFLSAEKYAHGVVPDSAVVSGQELSLRQFIGNVWFYLVKFDVKLEPLQTSLVSSPLSSWEDTIEVPVLMDGTVVQREERVLDPKTHEYVPVSQQKNDK
jgi:hypothetical protein